jgi:hypothetical protein
VVPKDFAALRLDTSTSSPLPAVFDWLAKREGGVAPAEK